MVGNSGPGAEYLVPRRSHAAPGLYVGGEMVLPAADPDELEADLAAELAYEEARDAVIAAAREVLLANEVYPGARWATGTPLHGLSTSLSRLDAAKANYPYGLGA